VFSIKPNRPYPRAEANVGKAKRPPQRFTSNLRAVHTEARLPNVARIGGMT